MQISFALHEHKCVHRKTAYLCNFKVTFLDKRQHIKIGKFPIDNSRTAAGLFSLYLTFNREEKYDVTLLW